MAEKKPWKPPSYAKAIDISKGWEPPDYAQSLDDDEPEGELEKPLNQALNQVPEDKRGPLKKAFDTIFTAPEPIRKFAADVASKMEGDWTEKELSDPFARGQRVVKSAIGGAFQGAAEMLNPGDMLATLTGLGAVTQGAKGSVKTAQALRRITQALSAPVAVHGAESTFGADKTWGERALGVAEMAGGGAGMHFPASSIAPTPTPPIRPIRGLLPPGPSYVGGPRGVADTKLGTYDNQFADVGINDVAPPDVLSSQSLIPPFRRQLPSLNDLAAGRHQPITKAEANVGTTGEFPVTDPSPTKIRALEESGNIVVGTLENGSVIMRPAPNGGPQRPFGTSEIDVTVPKSKTTIIPEKIAKPVAKYAHWQPDDSLPEGGFHQYEVDLGDGQRTHVGVETLQREGIDIPETPKDAVIPKSNEENIAIKNAAIAKIKAERAAKADSFAESVKPEELALTTRERVIEADEILPPSKYEEGDMNDPNWGTVYSPKQIESTRWSNPNWKKKMRENWGDLTKDEITRSIELQSIMNGSLENITPAMHQEFVALQARRPGPKQPDQYLMKQAAEKQRLQNIKNRELNVEPKETPADKRVLETSGRASRLLTDEAGVIDPKTKKEKSAAGRAVTEAKSLGINASNYSTLHGLNQAIERKRAKLTTINPESTTIKGEKKVRRSRQDIDNAKLQSAANAKEKLITALKDAKQYIGEQDVMNRVEKARRFAEYGNVKTTGKKGAAERLSKMQGEFDKVDTSKLKLPQKEIDSLFDSVKQSNITAGEKVRADVSLFKLLKGDRIVRSELRVLNDVFGAGFADEIIELQGGLGAVKVNIAKTANTMKAMMSSVDISGPLRQGVGLIHRKEWRDSFVEMFKYFGDKEYYEAAMEQLQHRQTYLLGRESGLFLSRPKDLVASEEAFANSYVHHLPVIRNIVGASERAYTGFLNKLRADTFDTLMNQYRRAGHEPFTTVQKEIDGVMTNIISPTKLMEDLAKYINNATGRGSLGSLEKMAPELNTIIWSPRLLSSRVQMFNPKYYADLDPIVRQEALKSLFYVAAAGTTLMGLGALAGGKMNANPRSSDFGKVRFGDKVLDPWAGHQQIFVAASRIITWSNETGPQNPATTTGRFAVTKASPIAGLIYDIASAQEFEPKVESSPSNPLAGYESGGQFRDRFGNDTSIQKETLSRFVPIFLQDLTETIQQDPEFAELVGLSGAAFIGIGVQDYPERRTSRQNDAGFRRLNIQP